MTRVQVESIPVGTKVPRPRWHRWTGRSRTPASWRPSPTRPAIACCFSVASAMLLDASTFIPSRSSLPPGRHHEQFVRLHLQRGRKPADDVKSDRCIRRLDLREVAPRDAGVGGQRFLRDTADGARNPQIGGKNLAKFLRLHGPPEISM
jgi:hypothetical protein